MTTARPGPLQGLRVLDLTQMLAGPYATMILADLGADVIKIEPPQGDMTRAMGPYSDNDEAKLFGGYFQSVNRNKRSVVLDLKRPEGVDALKALVKDCPVLVENFRPGVMDKLGLSYETLQEINPRLVYGILRGFGDPRTGPSPYSDWPAFDVVAQAMGGYMGITGTEQGVPVKSGPGVGDLFPAALLASGILAAVHHAGRTGEGQLVDVAMYDGILSLCERIVYQYSYRKDVPVPQGNGHPLLCPFGVFEASDGFIALAAPMNKQWARLCQLMGRPELQSDPRFENNEGRVRHATVVQEIVGGWVRRHSKSELMRILGGAVPAGPVQDVQEIFSDPHVAARQMIVDVEQPGMDTPVQIAGSAIKMTATPSMVRRRAPLLGEDQDSIVPVSID